MADSAATAIGVDVGGTWMRAARVDRDGGVQDRRAEKVAPGRDGFGAQLLTMVGALRDGSCTGVGVGIPGRVDPAGTILSAGFLDIAGLDLGAMIGGATGLPARIANDAAMAALAEAAASGEARDGLIAMVTVGTGIGGAVLQRGAPWHGGGLAGQFGHIVVAADGPVCKCGRAGCVETFSSGTALQRLMADANRAEGTRIEDVLAEAEAGNTDSKALADAWALPFQRALGTLAAVLDPELIIVGGGLGKAMVRALSLLPPDVPWFQTRIEAARLGDEAGVIGAALSVLPACGGKGPAA